MARFEVSNVKTGVNTANTIMWQFKASATSRARIFEIGLSLATINAGTSPLGPSWRLVRAATVGTSNATATAEEQDPGGGAATAVLDTGWSALPTPASVDMRRYATPNTMGSGIVWTWPDHRPFIVPISNGVCIVNALTTGTTPGTVNAYFVFEE